MFKYIFDVYIIDINVEFFWLFRIFTFSYFELLLRHCCQTCVLFLHKLLFFSSFMVVKKCIFIKYFLKIFPRKKRKLYGVIKAAFGREIEQQKCRAVETEKRTFTAAVRRLTKLQPLLQPAIPTLVVRAFSEINFIILDVYSKSISTKTRLLYINFKRPIMVNLHIFSV